MTAPGPAGWNFHAWGDPARSPVVWLHGFTWHGGAWEAIAQSLGDRAWSLAPDLPGHGRTGVAVASTFEGVVDALANQLAVQQVPPALVVGYSMGGRLALGLALRHPDRVRHLVLVGASAGLDTASERSERRAADRVWVELLESQGLEAFLDRWTALPLFSGLAALPEAERQHLRRLRERQDAHALAAALGIMGLGAQPPYRDTLRTLEVSVDLLVGEADAKFRALNASLEDRLRRCTLTVVPGCGHAVPFERPAALVELVSKRLTGAPDAPRPVVH